MGPGPMEAALSPRVPDDDVPSPDPGPQVVVLEGDERVDDRRHARTAGIGVLVRPESEHTGNTRRTSGGTKDTHTRTHAHGYKHRQKQKYTHTHTHLHSLTNRQTHTYTHTHTLTYTHTNSHAQTHFPNVTHYYYITWEPHESVCSCFIHSGPASIVTDS